MPLSLDSIFHPINDFFSQKFAGGDGGPVKFRFAHLPRLFVDSDFLNPVHPEWGPSPAIAEELFSTVVDGVTHLESDGRTVSLSTSSQISDLYHDEILAPAIPALPGAITDPAAKQALLDSFSGAKSDALGVWEKIKAESTSATSEFRPSTAFPNKWWDRTDPGIWTPQTFVVKGAATTTVTATPPDPVLRMKVGEVATRTYVQSYLAARPVIHPIGVQTRTMAAFGVTGLVAERSVATLAPASESARFIAVRNGPALNPVAVRSEAVPLISALPFQQRTEIQVALASTAASRPVVTSDVTIDFSYCLVTVTRPWFHDAFINNGCWSVAGQAKGQLSTNDGHGVPALPVGFVAIKSLSIKAPWTPDDIGSLELSDQFGPFSFDSKVVNGAVGHEGIQIIGWILKDVPPLPPN